MTFPKHNAHSSSSRTLLLKGDIFDGWPHSSCSFPNRLKNLIERLRNFFISSFLLLLLFVSIAVICGDERVKAPVQEPRSIVLGKHSKGVKSVVFSPDGKTVVSSSSDGTVYIWDVVSLKRRGTLEWGRAVQSVAFSPDGNYLATGGYERLEKHTSTISAVAIWKGLKGQRLRTLRGYAGSNAAYSVAFSPSGRLLAVGSGQDCDTKTCLVMLWEMSSGNLWKFPEVEMGSVCSIQFSPDGKTLAMGGIARDGKAPSLKFLDVLKGKVEAECKGVKTPIFSVAFSPNGKLLATGGGDLSENISELTLWDVAQKSRKAILRGLREPVATVAFSHDGKLLASGGGHQLLKHAELKLWDVETQREIVRLRGHSDMVRSVAFSPDDTMLVSGSHDGTVRLWYLHDPSAPKEKCKP